MTAVAWLVLLLMGASCRRNGTRAYVPAALSRVRRSDLAPFGRGDGPARERWAVAVAGDAVDGGGPRVHGDAVADLGWVQISHTSSSHGGPVLWMYVADATDVWYDAGKTFVVNDVADLARFSNASAVPPTRDAVLTAAFRALRARGFDSLLLERRRDGCRGCWARNKRVVEVVSLRPFRKRCPVSDRFMRGALKARRHDRLALAPCPCGGATPNAYAGPLAPGDVIC